MAARERRREAGRSLDQVETASLTVMLQQATLAGDLLRYQPCLLVIVGNGA
jgi:hypothetical protein